jgi:hypothetical protein
MRIIPERGNSQCPIPGGAYGLEGGSVDWLRTSRRYRDEEWRGVRRGTRVEYEFRLGYPDKHMFSIPGNIEGSVRNGSVESPVRFDCYFANPVCGRQRVQRSTGEILEKIVNPDTLIPPPTPLYSRRPAPRHSEAQDHLMPPSSHL